MQLPGREGQGSLSLSGGTSAQSYVKCYLVSRKQRGKDTIKGCSEKSLLLQVVMSALSHLLVLMCNLVHHDHTVPCDLWLRSAISWRCTLSFDQRCRRTVGHNVRKRRFNTWNCIFLPSLGVSDSNCLRSSHLRPVRIKPVGRIFDSNTIQGKHGKCGRSLCDPCSPVIGLLAYETEPRTFRKASHLLGNKIRSSQADLLWFRPVRASEPRKISTGGKVAGFCASFERKQKRCFVKDKSSFGECALTSPSYRILHPGMWKIIVFFLFSARVALKVKTFCKSSWTKFPQFFRVVRVWVSISVNLGFDNCGEERSNCHLTYPARLIDLDTAILINSAVWRGSGSEGKSENLQSAERGFRGCFQ